MHTAERMAHTATSATPRAAIDRALIELDAHKAEWVATDVTTRIAIIDQIRRDMRAVLPALIAHSLAAKGTTPDAAGDEWGGAVIMLRLLRLLRRSLRQIELHGRPQLPRPVTMRPDGQAVARVLPADLLDRLLFMGMTADVWMPPGITPRDVRTTQAAIYSDDPGSGAIALVLGAGNYLPLAPMDLLYKLFQANQVVILKLNPVNAYLGPLLAQAFRALIERGVLRLVYGDADEAAYIIHHPLVDAVHLTGSDRTYEAICFGTGAAGAQRKRQRQPLLTKPFTAELGSITPVIIVPGPWSAGDIRYQAVQLANAVVTNAGFNCLTPRVLVQHAGWDGRAALNRAISEALANVPTRPAYYPGAHEIHAAFVEAHPHAECHGAPAARDHLPWTFIPDVNPDNPDDICFTQEAFCGLFAETALHAADTPAFIDKAVDFVNNNVWGTLTATLVVHPRSLADPAIAAAVERAVANLRYGTVTVNFWGVLGIFLGQTPWGAFPGADMYDIQSGSGFVNNTYMLAHPQKTVIRVPFRTPLIPTYLTHRRYSRFFEKLAHFELDDNPARIPGFLWDALWR